MSESTNSILKGIRDGSGGDSSGGSGGVLMVPLVYYSETVVVDEDTLTQYTVTLNITFDELMDAMAHDKLVCFAVDVEGYDVGRRCFVPFDITIGELEDNGELVQEVGIHMRDVTNSDLVRTYVFLPNESDGTIECKFYEEGGK